MKHPLNPKALSTQMNPEQLADATVGYLGWYLYGITHKDVASQLASNLTVEGGVSLLMVEQGELAAVTRLVPHDAFTSDRVYQSSEDIRWLEHSVRIHNEVVECLHQAGAVLPVKFGTVYSTAQTIQTDLAEMQDALLARLEWLRACDEWGIRFYADRQAVQRIASEHPVLRQMQAEIDAASPGRAYLLKRKLADRAADITAQALSSLIQTVYRHLISYAVAGQMSKCPAQPVKSGDEREVLHAIFLVQRARADDFLEEVQRLVQEQDGLCCECSGPWPPYSFAGTGREEYDE